VRFHWGVKAVVWATRFCDETRPTMTTPSTSAVAGSGSRPMTGTARPDGVDGKGVPVERRRRSHRWPPRSGARHVSRLEEALGREDEGSSVNSSEPAGQGQSAG
jgi:hypothetical protein